MYSHTRKSDAYPRSYKARLNSDAELGLIDFVELIILNLINNVAESYEYSLNVSVSVLSMTDKQQIDSFVVKPRDIGR